MLWKLDPVHTSATFSSKHMMLTVVRGTMHQITGLIEYDIAAPENARVEAIIPVNTFNTGVPERDAHLRSADFLDSDRFPMIRFISTQVTALDQGHADIHGLLTLRDVTLPVSLKAEMVGFLGASWDSSQRVGFTASTIIQRERWGLTWNMGMEGGWLVGKAIKIELDVEAVRIASSETDDTEEIEVNEMRQTG